MLSAEATLGPCEGPKGLGIYARRAIAKGEVVASVRQGPRAAIRGVQYG
jgi:hypothetical protein